MHLKAWLIGDGAQHRLAELTARPGQPPPAAAWLPLGPQHVADRSGLEGSRPAFAFRAEPDGEPWVDFAAPPPVVADALGTAALAHPKALAEGSAPRSALRWCAGAWMVAVPRFFRTVASEWTEEPAERNLLITRTGLLTASATVAQLEIRDSFRLYIGEPDLLVTAEGPRQHDWRSRGYFNVGGLTPTEEVMAEIAALPADTTVTCVWYQR